MKLSKYYMPTLREDPQDAETQSHKYLLRGGFIRKSASGIYSFLPLGKKVLNKIETIVREAMQHYDSMEVLTSVLQPREIWDASGRWATFGPEMFKLNDRHDNQFCLGPTAEEYFTSLIKDELRSYKQLPLNIYQIVTKFRDEKRPRFGINRSREFLMKDAYSFDEDQAGLEKSYQKMWDAYEEVFDRLKLNYKIVEGDTGTMGGKVSHEFIALSETGEGVIFYTEGSNYAATDEKARFKFEPIIEEEKELELIETINCVTIDDVSSYLKIEPKKCAKAINLNVAGKPVFVFVPGDRELNMAKLISYLKVPEHEIEMMDEKMLEKYSSIGYTGPMVESEEVRIILDESITKINNMVIGANKNNLHYINANYKRDFNGEVVEDILMAREGDNAYDGSGVLKSARGIEVGNIFQLGTKYSESLEAYFLDKDGKQKPFIMGSYGIGISRSISAIVEQNYDEKGISWPTSVAPFEAWITVINNKNEEQCEAGLNIYNQLKEAGVDVCLDDRNERAGVKFNDRDLIGCPYRITVGKDIKDNLVEYSTRSEMKNEKISIDQAVQRIKDRVKEDLMY